MTTSSPPIRPSLGSIAIDVQNALLDKDIEAKFSKSAVPGEMVIIVDGRSAMLRVGEDKLVQVVIGPDVLHPQDPVALLIWWLTPSRGS